MAENRNVLRLRPEEADTRRRAIPGKGIDDSSPLGRALSKLAPSDRDLLVMTAEGFTAGEIARAVGDSVENVRKRRQRLYAGFRVNDDLLVEQLEYRRRVSEAAA